ncbi:MAG: hypothetical protein HYX53_14240 [Chloroflexi bacterium]|nr:hypothetical protein [Chloroflexota bacterium]
MMPRRALLLSGGAVAGLAVTVAALAQSASGWDLSRFAYGGGGTSTGSVYTVQGISGQPFALTSTGGNWTVNAGLLGGILEKFKRFAPFVGRD